MITLKMIGYAFAAAIAASLGVLFLGLGVFGLQFAQWAEWEGRIVGMVGTMAGVAGAVVGLMMALRAERRAIESASIRGGVGHDTRRR
ncbi:MAG: hypothetical protein HY327_00320 [Chloroflexi bacterium]|nr:hypothetical protein [Chloroflexota bacterium]